MQETERKTLTVERARTAVEGCGWRVDEISHSVRYLSHVAAAPVVGSPFVTAVCLPCLRSHLSVGLSACRPVCLSVCLSVSLLLSVSVPVSSSLSSSPSPSRSPLSRSRHLQRTCLLTPSAVREFAPDLWVTSALASRLVKRFIRDIPEGGLVPLKRIVEVRRPSVASSWRRGVARVYWRCAACRGA
jgi:hypothetical protein